MESKNYAEVLIGGRIYTLAGAEEESYLQRVASYISEKMSELKKQPGFTRQSADDQAVMIYLNLADDYFKAREEAESFMRRSGEMEKETYSLKHELVTTQMKLDQTMREAREAQTEAANVRAETDGIRRENLDLKEQLKAAQDELASAKAEAESARTELAEAKEEAQSAGNELATAKEEAESARAEAATYKAEAEQFRALQAARSSAPGGGNYNYNSHNRR